MRGTFQPGIEWWRALLEKRGRIFRPDLGARAQEPSRTGRPGPGAGVTVVSAGNGIVHDTG
jgi:hypothetical protein